MISKNEKIKEKGNESRKIYERRFYRKAVFRNKVYEILCSYFFQRYIPLNSVVLDIGAGYCEFINNIKADEKIAIDINPDIKKYANEDVQTIISLSTNIKNIKKESIDVVFVSNFFEHISKEDITKTLQEIYRILKKGGRLLILQPNIRYCYKDYWSFFDHVTPLDDRSLCEALKINSFQIIECRPKFLPFTSVRSKLANFPLFFLKMYLKAPLLSNLGQKIIGKQAFIYARKLK